MCKLTRRQLFLGGSGLILFGCGDSTTVEQAKDYYPVSQKDGGIDYVLHWGKNNTIVIDTNASGSPGASQPGVFQSGADEWTSTLQEVGVNLSYSNSSPDVKVNWLTGAEMLAETGILGFAAGLCMISALVITLFRAGRANNQNVAAATAYIVPLGLFFPLQSTADFFGQWNNIFLWSAVALSMAAVNLRAEPGASQR